MADTKRIEQLEDKFDKFQLETRDRLISIEQAGIYTNKTLDRLVITVEGTNAKTLKNEADIFDLREKLKIVEDNLTGVQEMAQASRDWIVRAVAIISVIGTAAPFAWDFIRSQLGI